jgi:hypothetical protein
MKRLAFFLFAGVFLAICVIAVADEYATTDSGRRVLLQDDGTWEYVQQEGGVVASFTGSGGKNTRPFTTPGPWEVQWDAQGDIFQLYLYYEDGTLEGVPANQSGPGTGSSYHPKKGTYYLQVNALGAWSIKIVAVE